MEAVPELPRKKQPVPKLGLALGSALLALVGVEVGLRVAGVDLNPNPRLRYHRVLGWTLEPGWAGADRITEAGFRHTSRMDRRESRRRVVVLGDSFSVAGQHSWDRTYPGLLQARLRAGGAGEDGGWEVVNLAASGWGTAQQLLALERYGLPLDPAAVVLQVFPNNDLCNNNLALGFSCSTLDLHRPYFVLEDGGLRRTHLDPLRARLRAASRLFGLAEVRLGWGLPVEDPDLPRRQRRAQRRGAKIERAREAGLVFPANLYALAPEPHQPPVIREGWRVTETLLAEISKRCRERGIPLVALVIPFAETFNPVWLRQQLADERNLVPDYDTARVEAALREHGAEVVSLRRRILAGAPPWRSYFYPHGRNDRHLSERGHARVAGWILEALARTGVVAAPGSDRAPGASPP